MKTGLQCHPSRTLQSYKTIPEIVRIASASPKVLEEHQAVSTHSEQQAPKPLP
jgi:hypothetical protein